MEDHNLTFGTKRGADVSSVLRAVVRDVHEMPRAAVLQEGGFKNAVSVVLIRDVDVIHGVDVDDATATDIDARAAVDQFIHERVRHPDDLQRVPLKHHVGRQSAKLVTAVELMEANIGEPISQLELAGFVDLSRRQLQRLFQQHLLCTPSRYYLQLRLQRARELLRQTDLSLVEIAGQTGFLSNSHFSKSYKEHYGYSPSHERRSKPTGRSAQS